jgi:hypothetical protein
MRIGVAMIVAAVLLGPAGCGGDSPAGTGVGRGDGGAGREGGGDAPADMRGDDVPASGGAGSSAGDAAGGSGGTGVAAAGGSTADAAGGSMGDAANAADASDARGEDGGADASMMDAGGEPVSMSCVAAGACDPFDPTSCGAKVCAIGLDGNTTCVTGVASPKGLGTACASRAECAGGLDCVSIGADPTTRCTRMCPRGSIGFCGGESRCTSFIAGCIQYCQLRDPPCDIYAQDCAGAGLACSLSVDGETGARYTGCRPAGTAARGDRCDQGATCGKGLLCVREGAVSTCRQICTGDGGASPCLAVGETCSGMTSTYQITYCR